MTIQKIEHTLLVEYPDFIRFLKEKKAFSSFFIELKRYICEIIQKGDWAINNYTKSRIMIPKEELILTAFNWCDSSEGAVYWYKLSIEWSKLVGEKQIV